MQTYEEHIDSLLGGVGGKTETALEWVTKIKEGFRPMAAVHLMQVLNIRDDNFATLLGTSKRTLARYRQQKKRLPFEVSDRLFRLARIVSMATEVLENPEQAHEWLMTGNRKLGGASPIELLQTEAGAIEVENLLGRIEHGIFA